MGADGAGTSGAGILCSYLGPRLKRRLPEGRLLLNPDSILLPPSAVTAKPHPGKMFIKPGEKIVIAKNLLSRRLVRTLRRSQLLHYGGKPLVNGSFGVSKGAKLMDGSEILRWIVNLTATNEVTMDVPGDIEMLPYFGQWRNIILTGDEVMLSSWEDLKCCFYVWLAGVLEPPSRFGLGIQPSRARFRGN